MEYSYKMYQIRIQISVQCKYWCFIESATFHTILSLFSSLAPNTTRTPPPKKKKKDSRLHTSKSSTNAGISSPLKSFKAATNNPNAELNIMNYRNTVQTATSYLFFFDQKPILMSILVFSLDLKYQKFLVSNTWKERFSFREAKKKDCRS